MPVTALLEQLARAGVSKEGGDDSLTDQDKNNLLDYLRRSHGEAEPKNKITLTRKSTSEIKAKDAHGRARTVQVEVRKKRVLVKRDTPEAAAEPVADEEDLSLAAMQPEMQSETVQADDVPVAQDVATEAVAVPDAVDAAPAEAEKDAVGEAVIESEPEAQAELAVSEVVEPSQSRKKLLPSLNPKPRKWPRRRCAVPLIVPPSLVKKNSRRVRKKRAGTIVCVKSRNAS